MMLVYFAAKGATSVLFILAAGGAHGTFGPYVINHATMGRALIYLCLSGSADYFMSSSADCESQHVVQTLGYVAPTKSGETLRALHRCNLNGTHVCGLTGACPTNWTQEALFGYVR